MAASEAMVAAGEHLSSSRPVRRAKTRPAARIPLCVEPPPPFAEGPGPGRDWWEKALSEKSFRAGKHENSQQNQSVGAKSRTTTFGPFGEVLRATGPMAFANPFRFSTKYQDDETGLLMYPARPYNPSTGRWLSRDPINEGGFKALTQARRKKLDLRAEKNLYDFVENCPISAIDSFGLAYTIVNLPPSGTWVVSLADVQVGEDTFKGFHSRYVPSNGKNGQPACPCKKENIILVQAVDDALSYPTHFDVGFPKHSPSDPIPAYYSVWKNAPKDQLTILDAPNFPDSPDTSGNWDFEDCAVCRTQASDGSITDQVLGCVTFRFHRKSQKEAELPGNGGAMASQAPGKLWNAALKNWQK